MIESKKNLLLIALLFSCKPVQPDSSLKHTWGNTDRASDLKVGACSEKEATGLTKTRAFLKELGEHIMKANPQTFKPGTDLDPTKFCFNVEHSGEYNATALSLTREISFNTHTVTSSYSYESIAMVMAHELAHISLRHSSNMRHPDYLPSEEFKSLESRYHGQMNLYLRLSEINLNSNKIAEQLESCIRKENPEGVGAFFSEMNKLGGELICNKQNYGPDCEEYITRAESEITNDYLNLGPQACRSYVGELYKALDESSRISQSFDGNLIYETKAKMIAEQAKFPGLKRAEAFNWPEREADEVGFELYVRAGFDTYAAQTVYVKFAYMDLGSSNDPGLNGEKCLSYLEKSSSINEISSILHGENRGESSHPAPCWRLLHHTYEKMLHKDDIERTAKLYPDSARLKMLWAAAKEEIKAFPNKEEILEEGYPSDY